jgi:hypothetical protein
LDAAPGKRQKSSHSTISAVGVSGQVASSA